MTRIEAPRALIERVETKRGSPSAETIKAALGRGDATHLFWATLNNKDRNAAAKLEKPLRERGWSGPWIGRSSYGSATVVDWGEPRTGAIKVTAIQEDEAPARLLAVLYVLLWEAEHDR